MPLHISSRSIRHQRNSQWMPRQKFNQPQVGPLKSHSHQIKTTSSHLSNFYLSEKSQHWGKSKLLLRSKQSTIFQKPLLMTIYSAETVVTRSMLMTSQIKTTRMKRWKTLTGYISNPLYSRRTTSRIVDRRGRVGNQRECWPNARLMMTFHI